MVGFGCDQVFSINSIVVDVTPERLSWSRWKGAFMKIAAIYQAIRMMTVIVSTGMTLSRVREVPFMSGSPFLGPHHQRHRDQAEPDATHLDG